MYEKPYICDRQQERRRKNILCVMFMNELKKLSIKVEMLIQFIDD